MVIPSLIQKISKANNVLEIWGDGSNIRDFVYSKDVAYNMLICLKNNINTPINIGSGQGVSIKKLLKIILSNFLKNLKIKWNKSKPSGDQRRVMSTKKADSFNIKCETL